MLNITNTIDNMISLHEFADYHFTDIELNSPFIYTLNRPKFAQLSWVFFSKLLRTLVLIN